MLHEVSMRRCDHMPKSLHWIGVEVCEFPMFDGIKDLNTFICDYQEQVPERDKLKDFDVALKATPASWWATHKENIGEWSQCKTLLEISFSEDMEYVKIKYTGQSSPWDHVELCISEWWELPR